MDNVTHTLGTEERNLIASLAGRKVSHIEGYRLDVFDGNVFHQVARIVMSDGTSLDLRNRFEALRLPNGLAEDAGTLTLAPSEGEVWLPEGVAVTRLPVAETVRRAAVVDDEDDLSRDGRPAARLAFTQAVVLELGSGLLAFDKGEWTDDYVHVRLGDDLNGLITDCSDPWVDGDGWTDEYQRRIGWL